MKLSQAYRDSISQINSLHPNSILVECRVQWSILSNEIITEQLLHLIFMND